MFFAKKAVFFAIVVLYTTVSFVDAAPVAARSSSACVYLKPKIYCYGGRLYHRDDSGQLALASNLFNSLDISEGGELTALQNRWESISAVEPGANFDIAAVAVPDHNAIFMDGGAGKDDNNGIKAKYNNSIYTIDDGKWTTDIPNGHLDGQAHTAVLGPKNTIYVWGGASYPDYTSLQDPIEYPLEMYLFHFETYTWSTGPAVSSMQLTRLWSVAALGKDETSIYYVGGQFPGEPRYENRTRFFMEPAPMNQILIFDINSQQWRTENTTGVTPSTRVFHSLTLKPSTGELILFGGVEPINQTDYRGDYSYLLDTERMEWSPKNVSNAEPGATFTATTIQEHSAILIGNELFIMFGSVPYEGTNYVRVLDVESWAWKASITGVKDAAPTASPSSDPESSDSGTSAGTIAGAVVGSIAGVAIIGAAIVFFWLRRRRQAQKGEELEPKDFGSSTGNQGFQGQGYVMSTSHTGTNDESTTQVSNNADPYRADASKFYGTEKPDGVQRIVMTPVKPDGA